MVSRGAALVLSMLALAIAACGGSNGGSELSVLAAASLRETLPTLDPDALYTFAGSDELAAQIREGAPADLYAAASPKYPQELFADGLVEEPVTFATNRLVVIVPADNPAGISAVGDLAKPGVKLIVAAAGVPVGDYTRQVLEALDLEAALDNVVSEEDDVKGVVGKVALGEADAGFVYATDVQPVEDDVAVVDIPPDAQPLVEYQIAVVADSDRKEEAQAFVERLLGEEGREALAPSGFGLP
jgi:molybdate transport system substrate-binding protein